MRYLGIDLAWGEGTQAKPANRSGVVALESSGVIIDAGWTIGLDDTVRWIEDHSTPDVVAFVDAPLVVTNLEKQRLCETQVGQRYWQWLVSANSTNTESPRRAGIHLRERLEALGWVYDDGTTGPPSRGQVLSECYPYTTIVGAEELGYDTERPPYKRAQKGMPAAEAWPIRTAACDLLISRVAGLKDHDPPADLASHEETRRLLNEPSPVVSAAYKKREDLLDAVICAWSAALWHRYGPARCQVLGVPEDGSPVGNGTIIAPCREAQRKAGARSLTRRRFLDIAMPERFVLEFLTDTGEWLDHGLYDAANFERSDDGTYACLGVGSPLYLRCLRQDGSVIYVIDGSSDPFTYRLVPFPGGGYS